MFVCTGNICRSPFAERLSKSLFDHHGLSGWEFSSAGIGALVGEPMDPLMRERLEARGGSAAGFAARQVDLELLNDATLILTLQGLHRNWILEEAPGALHRTFSLGQALRFAQEEAPRVQGQEFVEQLTAHRSRARGRDDIPDPYKRGPEAADKAAETITTMLQGFLPHLVEPGR